MRVCQVDDRVVLHRLGQSRDLPVYQCLFMDSVIAETPRSATEKPEHQIGRPAAMADDMPTKAGSSGYLKAIITPWVGNGGSDLRTERCLNPFVGIKGKNPVTRCGGKGTVF